QLGHNKNSFSEALGYSKNTLIYNYTHNDPEKRQEPKLEFFERLVQSKMGINIMWLLTGEGDMKLDESHIADRQQLYAMLDHFRRVNGQLSETVFNLSKAIKGPDE